MIRSLFILFQLCCPYSDDTCEVTISRVIDGDTYEIQHGADKISIRLLDFDCFESRRGKRLAKQAKTAGISLDSAYKLGKTAKQRAINYLLENTER